jgi:Cu-processing system permease protein
VLTITAVLALFSLVIVYFGAAQQGTVGFIGIEPTLASLVSLVIYLMPLIALLLGFDTIAGERERGSLDLLLSFPITPLELLLGKFTGLSLALALSTLAGFGLAGGLLCLWIDITALSPYLGFMFSAVLMGMSFLSLGVMVSVCAADRTQASGIAIGLWFFFVLAYDLLLLGLLVASEGSFAPDLVPLLLLLNPADVFRILNIFNLEEVRTLYGLATVFPEGLANPWLLGGVMLAWILAPLGIAAWRFK